jgi:hypothetical protein
MGVYENYGWKYELKCLLKELFIVAIALFFIIAFFRGVTTILCEPGPVYYDRGE